MSSVPEISESSNKPTNNKLESGPPVKDSHYVKVEEKSPEKSDLLESGEKISDVLCDAELKQDRVEASEDDILVEDMAPESSTNGESGVQDKPENGSPEKKTHDRVEISEDILVEDMASKSSTNGESGVQAKPENGSPEKKTHDRVEISDDILVEDMAPESSTNEESDVQAKPENGSPDKRTPGVESIGNTEYGQDTSSTEDSSIDKFEPVKLKEITMREFLENYSEEVEKPFSCVLDKFVGNVKKPCNFASSGYRVNLPDELAKFTGSKEGSFSHISKPATQEVPANMPSVFAAYTPPPESSSESENDTESESEQPGEQTYSNADVRRFRTKLVENLSNLISREQESMLFGGKEKINVLKVSSLGYVAKRLKPRVAVERSSFQISLDVSRFNKEAISCRLVGNKIEVYARELTQNDYGHEMHEIHQIFKVPRNIQNDKFIAYIRNGLLYIEAPVQIRR